MTSPNFDPLYSTDNIWLKADEDTCLSDHLDGMASDIESKAPASHTHSGYAPAEHTHTGYAASDHTHVGYAESSHTHTPASIGAAPESHSHDYAASSHGHAQSEIDGLDTALNGKAAANHSHTGFAAESHSHSYNDLTNKPTIPSAYSHPASHPASMITGLSAVATSGSYADLSDKPSIPSAYTHPTSHPASMITGLAKVATSGSYSDLSNKPTIPTIPASLPANGGNADTVDGKHATDFAASSHAHNEATTSEAGFMSASDKSKLDGIATGANKTTVDSALSSSSTNPVQNKVINAALAGKASSDHTHEAQAITAHLAASYYPAPVGDTYTTVPLTSSVVTGSALTVSNNKIRIGAGISKVMVSAQLCVGSSNISDNKFIAIRRTRGSQVTQLSRAQMLLYTNTTPQTMAVPGLLVDVTEGDLLTLDYYGKKDDTLYGDCLVTFLTVQKLA